MSDQKILFISHSEKDSATVEKFVDLLLDIGVPEESVFCSSISERGVPITVDIYDYLRNLSDSKEIVPIFMLSDHYYTSASCLNEMGALWFIQKQYFAFLLPGFTFSNITGSTNPIKQGIPLGYQSEIDLQNMKSDLNCFRQYLIQMFSLKEHPDWEQKRNAFITALRYQEIPFKCFNLRNHEGFCIGEFTHKGCIVTFDDLTNTLCADIDFHLTKAEICSAVIYTGEQNFGYECQTGSTLCFDLKTSNTIDHVDVECLLKNGNTRLTISTAKDWNHYEIPLAKFPTEMSEWMALKEIKFLVRREVRREDSLGGHIEIRNLCIKPAYQPQLYAKNNINKTQNTFQLHHEIVQKDKNMRKDIPHFKIGITFSGKYRKQFVEPICCELLKLGYSRNDIFYDEWHDALINGVHGDSILRQIYFTHCDCVVVLLSPDYKEKNWTGHIEWAAIKELINTGDDEKICLLRVDSAKIGEIDGLFSNQAIAKSIDDLSPSQVAAFLDTKYKLVC